MVSLYSMSETREMQELRSLEGGLVYNIILGVGWDLEGKGVMSGPGLTYQGQMQ